MCHYNIIFYKSILEYVGQKYTVSMLFNFLIIKLANLQFFSKNMLNSSCLGSGQFFVVKPAQTQPNPFSCFETRPKRTQRISNPPGWVTGYPEKSGCPLISSECQRTALISQKNDQN